MLHEAVQHLHSFTWVFDTHVFVEDKCSAGQLPQEEEELLNEEKKCVHREMKCKKRSGKSTPTVFKLRTHIRTSLDVQLPYVT